MSTHGVCFYAELEKISQNHQNLLEKSYFQGTMLVTMMSSI